MYPFRLPSLVRSARFFRWAVSWRTAAFGVILCCFALPADGRAAPQLYVYTEPDGTTRFTNKRPPQGVTAEVFRSTRGSVSRVIVRRGAASERLFLSEHPEVIRAAAKESGLSESLLRAVIHVESAFRKDAVSPKGAQGLMQIMPGTAEELRVKNVFQVEENIRAGARYLKQLLERYRGNMRLALAAYNAGPGAVDQHRGIPPFAETRDYVSRVMSLERRYQAAMSRLGTSKPQGNKP